MVAQQNLHQASRGGDAIESAPGHEKETQNDYCCLLSTMIIIDDIETILKETKPFDGETKAEIFHKAISNFLIDIVE